MWLDVPCYLIKSWNNHGDKLCTNTDDSHSSKMSLADLMSSKQRLTLWSPALKQQYKLLIITSYSKHRPDPCSTKVSKKNCYKINIRQYGLNLYFLKRCLYLSSSTGVHFFTWKQCNARGHLDTHSHLRQYMIRGAKKSFSTHVTLNKP